MVDPGRVDSMNELVRGLIEQLREPLPDVSYSLGTPESDDKPCGLLRVFVLGREH